MTLPIYSIEHITTIGKDLEVAGDVLRLSIEASVDNFARCCHISLYDPSGNIASDAAQGVDLQFAWSINGDADQNLFTGKIADVKRPERNRVDIVAFDDWNIAQVRKITATYIDQSPSQMLTDLVGKELAVPTDRIAQVDESLIRLPLFKMTIAQAVDAINRRMNLNHKAFIDEDGVFFWGPLDLKQDPAYTFEYGFDLLYLDLDRKSLTTWGVPIRLGQVVTVIDENQQEHSGVVSAVKILIDKQGTQVFATF